MGGVLKASASVHVFTHCSRAVAGARLLDWTGLRGQAPPPHVFRNVETMGGLVEEEEGN